MFLMPEPQPNFQSCHEAVKYDTKMKTIEEYSPMVVLFFKLRIIPDKAKIMIRLYGKSPLLGEKKISKNFGDKEFVKPSLV